MKDAVTQRHGGREKRGVFGEKREVFQLLVHHPNGYRYQNWAALKPKSFLQVPHMGVRAQALMLSSVVFPAALAGDWIANGIARTLSSVNKEYQQCKWQPYLLCFNASAKK